MESRSKENKRVGFADLAKLVAIYLVLWGHAIMQLTDGDANDNRMFLLIYSFHMPLFMIMSGYFAKSSFKRNFIVNICKRGVILIPSLAFGVPWFLHDAILGVRDWSIKDFVALEATCYWFLKCLFFACLISWGVSHCGRYKRIVAVATVVAFMLLQHFNLTFFKMGTMLPFFYIGIFLRNHIQCLEAHSRSLCLFAALAFGCLFPFYGSEHLFSNKFFEALDILSLSRYAFCLTMGLLGSIATISLCLMIDKRYGNNAIVKHFTRMGSYTLGIYLMQKLLLELLLPDFISNVKMNIHVFNYVFTPLVAIVFLYVCYYLTLWLERYKWSRKILLGNYK